MKEIGNRCLFEEIVDRVMKMKLKLKVMTNVNSQKLLVFVKNSKNLKNQNATDLQ
jgi:hypothetical protein